MDTFNAAQLCDEIAVKVPACSGWEFVNLDEQDFHADFYVRGRPAASICLFLHDESFTGFIKTPARFEKITSGADEFVSEAVSILLTVG